MNIIFAGTPAFGLPCLESLFASKHQIKAIYTQPDRKAGRGQQLQASAIKTWGLKHDIPIYQPLNFKDPAHINTLAELKPDVMVVIAYGLILPRQVLEIPRLGCINVHASLLPRWRGAAPIQYAILAGDKQTGITIMQMDVGMDTGDMLTHATCEITPNDTAEILHDRLMTLASTPLLQTLEALEHGTAIPIKQDNALATYAAKIKKEDAMIDWQQSAKIIDQQIRAFHPWPIAYTYCADLIVRVHQARIVTQTHSQTPGTILSINKSGILVATPENALLMERIQFPNAKVITVQDYLNSGRQPLQNGMALQ